MKTWGQTARVYLERRVVVILVLGFSSGLPLLLVYSTLSAWLLEEGVSKTMIGLFSWASIAYAFKFLWSPVVDRTPLPVLTRVFGQRRGWLLFSQGAVIAAILGLGSSDPGTDLGGVAFWVLVLAFASATQDIVIDAYRIESLDEDQLGAGAGNYVLGYRIAMLAAGGGALIVADAAGWAAAYGLMAVLMGIGVAAVLASPEPERRQLLQSIEGDHRVVAFVERNAHLPEFLKRVGARLVEAVVCPFSDFMRRPHWLVVLLFIAFYKYGDALLGVMANPFYLEIGFSKTEIGVISKGYGVVMTVIGGLIGGIAVARYGILPALLWCGVGQAASNLVFAAQAAIGASVPMLAVTISVENLTGGMATAAFVAYLSSLCNVAYTATQYALLSSLMAFARTIFASGGGWLADNVDWVSYFAITTVAAVPGLLILLWLMRQAPAADKGEPP